MKILLRLSAAFFCILAAHAEEKNGISVTVSKTTVEKNDTFGGGGNYDNMNRVEGLKTVIKNVSFKEMPEGEIIWTILVRKWGYYSSGSIESYAGTEKLKALKPAEATEMVVGNAQIHGYSDGSGIQRDKTEWRIVVKQGGKEIMRTQSTSSFDNLAKHAVEAYVPQKPK